MENAEREAVKQVIEESYIRGIHGDQDEKTVRSGFHQHFAMLVLQGDDMEKVTVDEWLRRIDTMKQENPELWAAHTTHDFGFIDVTGSAAVAKLDVYKGPTHFSTDHMLIYRFEDGWRIVSKVFAVPT